MSVKHAPSGVVIISFQTCLSSLPEAFLEAQKFLIKKIKTGMEEREIRLASKFTLSSGTSLDTGTPSYFLDNCLDNLSI